LLPPDADIMSSSEASPPPTAVPPIDEQADATVFTDDFLSFVEFCRRNDEEDCWPADSALEDGGLETPPPAALNAVAVDAEEAVERVAWSGGGDNSVEVE
jgi:hypothetical protein